MGLFTGDIEQKVDARIERVLAEVKQMHNDSVVGQNDLQKTLDLLLDEQKRTNELLRQLLEK